MNIFVRPVKMKEHEKFCTESHFLKNWKYFKISAEVCKPLSTTVCFRFFIYKYGYTYNLLQQHPM